MSAPSDRTVHGRTYSGRWEIVRYARSGKWYLEAAGERRQHIGVHHAATLAAQGDFTPGLHGGRTFDWLVREKRRGDDTG